MSRQSVWQNIWSKKYEIYKDNEDLHVAAGYDMLSYPQWKTLTSYFINKLNLKNTDHVLEVGCGCGAFLNELRQTVDTISGIDYSAPAIERLKSVMPGQFRVSQASEIPFESNSFDCVASFGVFFYFENFDYASISLNEMLRVLKPGGRIFIGEVSDIAKVDIANTIRNGESIERSTRKVSDQNPDHLYYEKSFFTEYAHKHELECEIVDEAIEELNFYPNSRYRFSVILTSNKTVKI